MQCAQLQTPNFSQSTYDFMSGFNLLIYNVNTTHLARTYRGIPSGWGQYHLHPSALKWGQYEPPAYGRRFIFPFQGLRISGGIAPIQTVFPDTSSLDVWYSIITVTKLFPVHSKSYYSKILYCILNYIMLQIRYLKLSE